VRYLKKNETDEVIFESFPKLTKEELEAVNDLYQNYLFYETSGRGRKVWTSCCHHREEYIGYDMRVIEPQHWEVLGAKHNEKIHCPFCGREVTVKNKGIARKCNDLKRYIPVVFFHVADDGETVYAQAYWTKKDFYYNYAEEPLYRVTSVYRFKRGEAIQWQEDDYRENEFHRVTGQWISEPFRSGGVCSANEAYYTIGLDRLENSFLKYTGFKRWESRWTAYTGKYSTLLKFLGIASKYPENVEMLMKMNMGDVIGNWVYSRKKNAAAIKWGEKDPRKAFGINGGELKEFLSTGRDIEILTMYKTLQKRGQKITFQEVADIRRSFGNDTKKMIDRCAKLGLKPMKVIRYLDQFTGGCHCGGYRSRSEIYRHWTDYLDAAKDIGYDLTEEVVLLPRDLQEAHDTATGEYRRRIKEVERRKKAEADEKLRLELLADEKKLERRTKNLKKKYCVSTDRYFIRVPESREEIIAEGQALKHCVAGYADRHFRGVTTILFLRSVDQPDKSLVTIEMDGKRLVQVHGFRNECQACPENPDEVSARSLYAEILDPWLDWIDKGSKRDKQGNPIMFMKKEKEIEVA
jgi:hypothetical protein